MSFPVCMSNTKVLCFPKDMVNNLNERILQIADEYPTVTNIVLHTGSNDVSKQQSEVLKRDFTGLLNTVNSLNAAVFISGPVPPVRGGDERFSRLFALNKWLISACTDHSVHFINNLNIFWERRHLKHTSCATDCPQTQGDK
uniref:SGNH hydrolase-type esterase domain-containing protein n=1 Tax=Neolamprologus brichardi TaxID=32507 RepID=A0A3Q4I4H4_NEOBR